MVFATFEQIVGILLRTQLSVSASSIAWVLCGFGKMSVIGKTPGNSTSHNPIPGLPHLSSAGPALCIMGCRDLQRIPPWIGPGIWLHI